VAAHISRYLIAFGLGYSSQILGTDVVFSSFFLCAIDVKENEKLTHDI